MRLSCVLSFHLADSGSRCSGPGSVSCPAGEAGERGREGDCALLAGHSAEETATGA